LELEASSRHNDLVLRCTPAGCGDSRVQCVRPEARRGRSGTGREAEKEVEKEALEQEVALLRAENAALRGELQNRTDAAKPQPALLCGTVCEAPRLQYDELGFDDPFEPPPEAGRWRGSPWGVASSPAPSCSTSCGGGRDFAWESASSACGGGSDFGEYADTPRSSRLSSLDFPLSKGPSGAMTPQEASLNGGEAHATFLPTTMWWTLVPSTARGALAIPCGIVQSMRAHFEQGAGAQ